MLRGFAVLGILLLNIIGFGLPASAYFNPVEGAGEHPILNLTVWAVIDILFEGAMRGLFSLLFGAGVVMLLSARAGGLLYRRHVWLLVFGLLNGWVLLWNGDILTTYALAGLLLVLIRDASVTRLFVTAGILIALTSTLFYLSQMVIVTGGGDAGAMTDPFITELRPSPEVIEDELVARRTSYATAFAWNATTMLESYLFVLPVYLLPDALIMMLIGMGLYRLGILDGSRTTAFYIRLCTIGFAVGLSLNGYEVWTALGADFSAASTFGYLQPTYHLGRLGMTLGYVGLIMLLCKGNHLPRLRTGLAAAGRMALTNYLAQSCFCLLIFTGAGLGLVGVLERWSLYVIVLGIWVVQLTASQWWLRTHRQGPLEWLWRGLTYRTWATNRRTSSEQ